MKLEPKVINAESGGKEYVQLLGGPPESISMRSGKVVLQPGGCVGRHSTEDYEELLILLEGAGSFLLDDGRQLEMNAGSVLYCPPDTAHDVRNNGSTPLQYIYVVAKAG
ncbi:MAG: cupin domain-containing protein [Bellilinea sp.]